MRARCIAVLEGWALYAPLYALWCMHRYSATSIQHGELVEHGNFVGFFSSSNLLTRKWGWRLVIIPLPRIPHAHELRDASSCALSSEVSVPPLLLGCIGQSLMQTRAVRRSSRKVAPLRLTSSRIERATVVPRQLRRPPQSEYFAWSIWAGADNFTRKQHRCRVHRCGEGLCGRSNRQAS